MWLVCQLLVLVTTPLALCCERPGSMTHHDETCCPGVGPGQVCPMHHTREGERTCRMVNACGPPDTALSALASGLGILTQSPTSLFVLQPLETVPTDTPSSVNRARHPDAPPPRI
jgi:hypothetical protein